jgi:hypothetical protein
LQAWPGLRFLKPDSRAQGLRKPDGVARPKSWATIHVQIFRFIIAQSARITGIKGRSSSLRNHHHLTHHALHFYERPDKRVLRSQVRQVWQDDVEGAALPFPPFLSSHFSLCFSVFLLHTDERYAGMRKSRRVGA